MIYFVVKATLLHRAAINRDYYVTQPLQLLPPPATMASKQALSLSPTPSSLSSSSHLSAFNSTKLSPTTSPINSEPLCSETTSNPGLITVSTTEIGINSQIAPSSPSDDTTSTQPLNLTSDNKNFIISMENQPQSPQNITVNSEPIHSKQPDSVAEMISEMTSHEPLPRSAEEWREKGAASLIRKESDEKGQVRTYVIKKGVKDFEFGKTLGIGSYSTVVCGRDKQSLRQYAIKILDKRHIIREKKVKYVEIEKRTLNRLGDHPGIIPLYYTFQDENSLYFVLDYASNGELLSLITKVRITSFFLIIIIFVC